MQDSGHQIGTIFLLRYWRDANLTPPAMTVLRRWVISDGLVKLTLLGESVKVEKAKNALSLSKSTSAILRSFIQELRRKDHAVKKKLYTAV